MMPRPKTGGVNPMKLKSLCSLKTGYVTADFWVVRRGSIESLGKPTRNFNPEHIGVKVERSDIVIEKWLFYVFEHLNTSGYFKALAKGTISLQHITISDVGNIQFKQ